MTPGSESDKDRALLQQHFLWVDQYNHSELSVGCLLASPEQADINILKRVAVHLASNSLFSPARALSETKPLWPQCCYL